MAEPPLVSVCLIVRDEEERLPACLASVASVASVAGEIVVADTGSRDRTVEIARERGARVVSHPWADDFAAARNAALDAATGRWVLAVDADEVLEDPDAGRLRARLASAEEPAFSVEVVSARGGGRVEVAHLCRLFRREPGIRYEGRIHESVLGPICRALGRETWTPPRSGLRLRHAGYEPALRAARGKQERNRRLLAAVIAEAPDDPGPRFLFARENAAAAGGDLLDTPATREALDVLRPAIDRLLALPPRGITEPALALGARLSVAIRDAASARAWLEALRTRFGTTALGAYAAGELALLDGPDLAGAAAHFRAASGAPDASPALPAEAALREQWAPLRAGLCAAPPGAARPAAADSGDAFETTLARALLAFRAQGPAAAVPAVARAIEGERDDPRGWWALGVVLAAAGDAARARAMAATALKAAPGWSEAEALAAGAEALAAGARSRTPAGLLSCLI